MTSTQSLLLAIICKAHFCEQARSQASQVLQFLLALSLKSFAVFASMFACKLRSLSLLDAGLAVNCLALTSGTVYCCALLVDCC